MNINAKLNGALAQIERARANFLATVNEGQLEPDALGRLATIDDSLAKAEKEFQDFLVDAAIAENHKA